MTNEFSIIRLFFICASLLAFVEVIKAGVCRTNPITLMKGPSLSGATGWLNSPALSLAHLRGKVVLIEFWTYTCINWRRALPYTRAWADRYADKGLIVIGVHSPEFSFEHNAENVRQAVKDMNIHYPVAFDNEFKIWRSFKNQYWPAMYLIDAKGKLRYQKFGEGEYFEAERKIQELLQEASGSDIPDETTPVEASGVELGADWENLRSPEDYFGYGRSKDFVQATDIQLEKAETYSRPEQLRLNEWGLSGTWLIARECIRLGSSGGKIVYRFHARDLHLVMGPTTPGATVQFRILINGHPPKDANGADVDTSGKGKVVEQRMYHLIRQQEVLKDQLFEIEFTNPGVEVFNITFG